MSTIGCALTNVVGRHRHIGTEKIVKPERIYVYPFAPTHAAIPFWSTAKEKYAEPSHCQPERPNCDGNGRSGGEMIGRTKIEGAAKRTVRAIGKELRIRIREEDLIK
ncbi:hypothetical protein PJI16_04385 [Nitrospira sp. MA-1]|nr:hypothetical protein [Nitrospira sp. MA-1]